MSNPAPSPNLQGAFPVLPLNPGDGAPTDSPEQQATRAFLESVQGGILAGAGRGEHAAMLFFNFADPNAHAPNAAALADSASRVTTAMAQFEAGRARKKLRDAVKAAWGKEAFDWPFALDQLPNKAAFQPGSPAVFRSMGLTGPGLMACGVLPNAGDGAFPPDKNHHFRNGLKAHTDFYLRQDLRRFGEWASKLDQRYHGVWVLGAASETERDVAIADQTRWCGEHGMVVTHRELGLDFRPGNVAREPFGFEDGISQPRFFDYEKRTLQNGDESPPHGAADMPLTDVFLGANPAHDLGGSFLVFQKMEQNVHAFRQARQAEGGESLTNGWVGRDPDGMPLVSSAVGGQMRTQGRGKNDFSFEQDRGTETGPGPQCPFHAHIRRANPRGHMTSPGGKRPRVVRRSWVYGDPAVLRASVTPGGPHPKEGVGLLFMAYFRELNDFGAVNFNWLGGKDHPVKGAGPHDPLIHGQSKGEPLVTVKGGDYFYVPSMAWLRARSGGAGR